MTTEFKASLIGNRCTSPDGTMVHAPTDKIVTLAEYFAKCETGRLRDALHKISNMRGTNGADAIARLALTQS